MVRGRGRTIDGAGSSGMVETMALFPPSPLQAWRQTHFGSPFNSGVAADTADPDRDGIENLAEFAFAMDPNQASAGQWPHGQIPNGDYVITFTQPAGVSGITYRAEWSATLEPGSWTAVPDTGVLPQHRFQLPIGTASKRFLRLKVTVP